MPSIKDEAETRETLIDIALTNAGWGPIVRYQPDAVVNDGTVTEYPTASGPADYLLFHRGRPLAVVEAKREGLGPQNVLVQAERYAQGLNGSPFTFGRFHLPFAYSTNGTVFWFRDLRSSDSASREIAGFHTPEALEEALLRDESQALHWMEQNPEDHAWLRPYQKDAIQSVEEALGEGKRRMLVAMATGTGKTVTTIALLYRLLKSGYAKRILWLVDRRALAAQAATEMAAFEVEPGLKFDKTYEVYTQRFQREDFGEDNKFDLKVLPNEYLTHPDPGHSFVYICTIQRMRINLFGRPEGLVPSSGDLDEDLEAAKLDIPIHAFDFIVADECHRGYTSAEESKWREVLDHFDAVKLGLTATPAAHTKAYFEDIAFRYDYERAVREGYLVDYDVVQIASDVRMNGVFLRPGDEVELVDTQTGRRQFDVLEDERDFDTSEIERKVTAPDSNRRILEEYLRHAREHEQKYGRFPKTLIFAVNDLPHVSHADELVRILRGLIGRGDEFVAKITGSPTVDRPLQQIRKYRNRDEPAIAVTVDMLTTGVDIPRIEALLFLRPAKSRILFEQMLGRGTRKCLDISKTHFVVFDAVGVLEYFKNASAFTVDPPDKPSRSIADVIAAIDNNQDREYNTRVFVKRLQRIAKEVTSAGRDLFAAYIPAGDIGGFAQRLPDLLEEDLIGTMAVLKNHGFLELLENYPRPPKTFVVATGVEDTVTSAYRFRTADGRELRPTDYIQAFERYVRENPDQIEALSILLKRPRDFDTRALTELRRKLAEAPERFTEPNLRKAYQKELADIIALVRHAALGEPFVLPEERAARALKKVKSGHSFTPPQEQWLRMIQDHLASSLLIEKEQFDTIPFSRHGGWKRANEDFNNKLEPLLPQINYAAIT